MRSLPRVMVIGGSDSGAGAGIQADIKTVAAFGGYATTVITAVTAQNTLGVPGVFPVAATFIAQQIQLLLEDIGTDSIKTGMLVSGATIEAVADALTASRAPLVIDPVMVAKGGTNLLDPAAIGRLCELLLPRAALVTPNVPEAELLLGVTIEDLAGMRRAAQRLSRFGAGAVLIKGGHLGGSMVHDVLLAGDEECVFSAPRLESQATHGTGCTLASAIAAGLAAGRDLGDAVEEARRYVRAAMASGLALGRGHRPLDHSVPGPWGRV